MLKDFFKKHGWRYIPGSILVVICPWIQTRAPLALGRAVELATQGNWDAFFGEAMMIFWIALGVFVTRFGWRWFIILTSREMEVYLRDRLYTHLMNLPIGFFGHTRSGDLMAYAVNDVNTVRQMFGMVFANIINAVSVTAFSVSEMTGTIDPRLTLYSLLPVPLAIAAVVFIGKGIRIRARYAQDMFSKISGHVQENINGMRVLKAFAQEKPQYAAYEEESLEKKRANERLYFLGAYMNPVIKTVFGISYAIGLIYGGTLVMNGQLQLNEYIAFNAYLTIIVSPVVAVSKITNNLQRGLASYKRLKELMDVPEADEFERRTDMEPVETDIRAEHLTFQYADGTEPVLKDVMFHVKQGGMLGIVGPTGSGKTTVFSLITKLVMPERGQLFVGGKDIRDIPAATLRNIIGYVPQDGFLFDESIRDNVRFFSDAEEGTVLKMLDTACMIDDLLKMPDGLDTMCGERGNHLSGGQRQRVSLARALVKNPKILLLDDTLSAVDAQTEKKILSRLKEDMENRTCIVVAHRLSAVRDADEILFMDDGKIVERGTHEELLKRNGAYAHLYELQNKKEDE